MVGERRRVRIAHLPVQEGARVRALPLISDAGRACRRLDDIGDGEALHDFRVALRRLRTFVRAYEAYLPWDRKRIKRLRSLAKNTNAARDLEVTLSWLRARRTSLSASERTGLDELIEVLARNLEQAYRRIRSSVPGRWEKLASDLLAALHQPIKETNREAPTFGQVSGALGSEYCNELESNLKLLTADQDYPVVHRTRISGKRLRYLLEPFRKNVAGAEAAVEELKRLQDELGSLCDNKLVLDEILSIGPVLSGERARSLLAHALSDGAEERRLRSELQRDALPGLLAIAQLAVRQQKWQSAKVAQQRARRHATALADARRVTDGLGRHRRPRGRNVVRKNSVSPSSRNRRHNP